MKSVLIYAGTSEGRELAHLLAGEGFSVEVCVATEYGEQSLQDETALLIRRGRMDAEQMRALHEKGQYLAVVDATHPFATEVTKNIRESLAECSIPYLRLSRQTQTLQEDGIEWFADAKTCASALAAKEDHGRILLTTGSKELAVFCGEERLRKRLVVRVLPGRDSMQCCWENGLSGAQIIAMQGPFSKEMNLAVIRQYGITCLVTKESGSAGGEEEKTAAAREAGIPCMMIRRPVYGKEIEELSEQEVVARVKELSRREGVKKFSRREGDADASLHIVLAGMGMGDAGSMTVELERVLERTDVLFGAPRLLEGISVKGIRYPYYLAKDILPILSELREECIKTSSDRNVTILFSGDSGFFSGCKKLKEEIERAFSVQVQVLPGISSLSAFCARIGMDWQDALIVSAHGVSEENWTTRLLYGCRHGRKIFLLTSGPQDLQRAGMLLSRYVGENCRVWIGYQLSYPEEKVAEMSPRDLSGLTEKGLYVAMILPERSLESEGSLLAPGWRDETFLRGKTPMTKEEVRELSICKLRLRENAVVYDIGSGTGTVGLEIAALSDTVQVFAIECDADALLLTAQNKERLGLENLQVVEGFAPEAMERLPVPTHAFIGGSRGRLREILEMLYQKNPRMRVVMNAVSLEGIAQMHSLLQSLPVEWAEITTVQVSKAKKAGDYHLMTAANPVTVFSFEFREET